MANPQDWGPPFWRLLHSLAERLGTQTLPLLVADEQRAWTQLLTLLTQVLPCAKCKEHYRAWKTKHPIASMTRFQGTDLKRAAREWLWSLHTEVNTEKGVQSPTLEEVQHMYGTRRAAELTEDTRRILQALQAALPTRLVTPEAIHSFRTTLSLLRRFTG